MHPRLPARLSAYARMSRLDSRRVSSRRRATAGNCVLPSGGRTCFGRLAHGCSHAIAGESRGTLSRVLTTFLPARGDSGPGELLCFAERSTQHDQAQCSDDEPDVVLIDLIDLDVVLVEHHKRLLTVNGHVQGLLDSTG